MGRPEETAELLQEGLSAGQIARRFGISIGSVQQYLWRAIGEGLIRRSDVLFSFPKTLRHAAEQSIREKPCPNALALSSRLVRAGVKHNPEELELLWKLMVLRVGYGDLYDFIAGTEKLLHDEIHRALTAEFGEAEPQWWRQGVPEKVRVDCVTAREKDPDADADTFSYTTFIHLREILDRQWPLFLNRLPKDIANDKKAFLRDLEVLNGIRNRVMHPIRLHHISDDDFEFAREMHRKLRAEAWRKPPARSP